MFQLRGMYIEDENFTFRRKFGQVHESFLRLVCICIHKTILCIIYKVQMQLHTLHSAVADFVTDVIGPCSPRADGVFLEEEGGGGV